MTVGAAVATGIGQDFAQTVLSGSLIAGIAVSLIAGLVSFASPCVVPLVPGYLAYVSGMAGAGLSQPGAVGAVRGSVRGAQARTARGARTLPGRPGARLVLGALLFVAGFTVVFVVLGMVFGLAGAQLKGHLDIATRVLGVLVVVLGLVFMGAVPFMQTDARIHMSPRAGLWGAPLLGLTFGLGWTPCIGPTLSAVLALGLSEATQTRGIVLALAYSLGLGLPFVVLALLMDRSTVVLAWLRRHRVALMRVGGAVLIVLGVLLVTGLWGEVTAHIQGWVTGFRTSV